MKIRATLLSFAKVAAVITVGGACASTPNKVLADTPVLPYQAPDIAEITGIEEDDEDTVDEEEAPASEPEAAPAPAPAPAPAAAPAKAPAPAKAAPAKTPAQAKAPAPAKK
jgi:2-oxoglutarate dehydrogenase E2 component (dihydrolipoamide succinyltransferase)